MLTVKFSIVQCSERSLLKTVQYKNYSEKLFYNSLDLIIQSLISVVLILDSLLMMASIQQPVVWG